MDGTANRGNDPSRDPGKLGPVSPSGYNFFMPFTEDRSPGILSRLIRLRLPVTTHVFAIVSLLLLGLTVCSCGRHTGVPDSDTSQKLPFDREPSKGTTPTQSLIPPPRIPEGTSLTVRLSHPISSAVARPGESLDCSLDDPVIIDEQTLIPRGSQIKGRILDAKPSSGADDPGYLRIALVSVDVRGTILPIDSSSIFSKAPAHPDHLPPHFPNDTLIPSDRRLTFRLARAIDLQ
jgi:hypothetical protein